MWSFGRGIMKKRFYVSLAALVVLASGLLLTNVFNANSQAALPRDCDNNAIIHCGAITPAELVDKYNKNQTGDLKAIYDHYGISGAIVTAGAPLGEVHKDGRVTLNGQTVATGANSIGRQKKFSGSTQLAIGGKEYYQTPTSHSFARESITAYIFLDKNGQFIGAILTSCGNPVSAHPVPKPPAPTPKYKCVGLTASKISRNEYSFNATANAKNGAVITGYRYDFGDGKSEIHPPSATTDTRKHTYDQPGEYVAILTVLVKANNQVKEVTDGACKVNVPVKPQAAYSCDTLTARLIKKEDRTYAYDLKYTVTGGATLKTVDFDFGDNQSRLGMTPAELQNVTHSYANAGTFTTIATLHFMTGENGNTMQDDQCQVAITEQPEVCPHNPQLPKDSLACVPPVAELPKTGPADFVIGGLGLGSIVAAGYYWFTSRRDLMMAWLEK